MINLYSAVNGNLLGVVDVGDGYRAKAWLDELSQIAMEAATAGYGVEANFPAILDGSQLAEWPLGIAAPRQRPAGYAGVTLFKAYRNTMTIATGTGAVATVGAVAPTTPGRDAANYGGAGAGDAYVPTPQGCTAAARATSAGGAYNCGANPITFDVIVNGVTYTVTGTAANAAAVTDIEVMNFVNDSLPSNSGAYAILTVGGAARILTNDEGAWNSLNVVNNADSAVIFAASGALGATVTGCGGPLNHLARQTTGAKPQRRILPQSVIVTTTVAGNAITVTDNGLGVLAGNNGLGQTAAGTINYTTGAISITYSANVTNLIPVVAVYQSLIPVDLETQVKKIPNVNQNLAILLN